LAWPNNTHHFENNDLDPNNQRGGLINSIDLEVTKRMLSFLEDFVGKRQPYSPVYGVTIIPSTFFINKMCQKYPQLEEPLSLSSLEKAL